MDRDEQQLQATVDRAAAEVARLRVEVDQAQQRNPRDQEEVNRLLRDLRTATQGHLDAIRHMRQEMERWNANMQKALTMIKMRDGRPEQ